MNRFTGSIRKHCLTGTHGTLLSDNLFRATIAIILCYIGYCFFTLPILSTGDTDMWYHLSGGRYFFQHHKIATTGFFSFLAQSREWPNYYWLFQVLLYSIYSITSYYGLVIFKALMFLITVLTIALFLFKDIKDDRQKFYFLVLFIVLSIGLTGRYYTMLRPHIFSYLFIPLFIYLIESRSRALFILPLLTVAWVNTHGIEYPVILLIVGSYLFEFIVKRFKEHSPISRDELHYILPLALSLLAVFITPYGAQILSAPFSFADNQEQFIEELRHIKIADFFSWDLFPFGGLIWCSINILIISACFGCIKGLWKRDIRTGHLLLFAGGIFLLTQAARFRYEAVMLSLPLLKCHPLLSSLEKAPVSKPGKYAALSVITLSFLIIFHSIFIPSVRYPFSPSNFPKGITTFLNHIRAKGTVLNEPVHGGYLQWELDPGYRIAMDLQTILFSDQDYFSVLSALSSKDGFASFNKRFKPDFIASRISNKKIKEFISSFPEYRLVFFDYSSVLYINSDAYPDIAKRYEIKELDPYTLIERDLDALDEVRSDSMLNELHKIQSIYPEDLLVNLQMGRIYCKRNDIEKALTCADTVINNYPEMSHGYILKGDIHKQLGSADQAIVYYKKALGAPFPFNISRTLKSLALAYNKAGDDRDAYKTMKKAVYIYTEDVNYKDLWQLGNMALKIGKVDESLKLLNFSLIKAPEDDKDFIERLNKQLDKIKTYSDSIQL